ncbi:MAG: hypothetical protein HY815_29845 [Candidatus Riflebacteria bacterium]|nr:hypothetical protein [Candidatus Riflebacteria bacterium]
MQFRSILVCACLVMDLAARSALAQAGGAAAGATGSARERLEQMRRTRAERPALKRVAVLPFANRTPKAGASDRIAPQVAAIFAERGFEIVPADRVSQACATHAAGTPFTDEELAAAAKTLEADTIVGGALLQFRSNKTVGVPLPGAYVRTHATAEIEAFVFRRSQGRVVFRETVLRHDNFVFMAVWKNRDEMRDNALHKTLKELLGRYFASGEKAGR